jgi:hypothetical protein
MLVLERSNGRSAMTVNLAPHSVQFVKGNRLLLLLRDLKSATQFPQIAVSVGIRDTRTPS